MIKYNESGPWFQTTNQICVSHSFWNWTMHMDLKPWHISSSSLQVNPFQEYRLRNVQYHRFKQGSFHEANHQVSKQKSSIQSLPKFKSVKQLYKLDPKSKVWPNPIESVSRWWFFDVSSRKYRWSSNLRSPTRREMLQAPFFGGRWGWPLPSSPLGGDLLEPLEPPVSLYPVPSWSSCDLIASGSDRMWVMLDISGYGFWVAECCDTIRFFVPK